MEDNYVVLQMGNDINLKGDNYIVLIGGVYIVLKGNNYVALIPTLLNS